MSEDLTKNLPASDSDKLTLIVTEVQRLNVKTDAMQERLSRVEKRLQDLDDKVEERLYDTRPIWEKLVTDVAHLQDGQQRLEESHQRLEKSQQRCEERFEVLQKESREIKTFMRDILRRMSIFFETLVPMQADYRDIYDRVRSLEMKNG